MHSLLGEFKPCPFFESRQINRYENNNKCHHFKEIREGIVRACGKNWCAKHGWQKVQSAAESAKKCSNSHEKIEKF